MKKDPITVYWAPSHSIDSPRFQYYTKPERVIETLKLMKNRTNQEVGLLETKSPGIMVCPAFQNIFKDNLYQIKSTFNTEFKIPSQIFNKDFDNVKGLPEFLPIRSTFNALRLRPSSFSGYQNIIYDMSWFFFASEPLIMRITPPWFPHKSPCEGAILSSGEYDIGQWYRQVSLDYHIPNGSTTFKISEGDPLIYIEFKTERPVILKKYIMTEKIGNLQDDYHSRFRNEHGTLKSLLNRYSFAKQSGMNKEILEEINNNTVND